MQSKKLSFLLIGLLPLIAGCTFSGFGSKPADFTSLYSAHTKSQVSSFRTLAEKLGYLGKYKTEGKIAGSVDIPALLSGSFSALYTGNIEGYGLSQDSELHFTSPSLKYETLIASGGAEAKALSLISRGGDMFLKFEDVHGAEFIDEAVQKIFDEYNNMWLGLTESNLLETLSGASEEEKMSFMLSQALGKIRIDDVEGYLIKYPLWKEVKSLGVVNGMNQYEVELAADNIVALTDEFTKKSTGKNLSEEQKSSLLADLKKGNIHGVMSYDANNPKVAKLELSVSSEEGTMTLVFDERADGWNLSSTASGATAKVSLTEKSDGYTFEAGVIENGAELGSLIMNISLQNSHISHIDAKLGATEQGLSLTFEQNIANDGSFSGSLNAGIGSLTWNGKIDENRALKEFHAKGAMIGSSLTLDLTPGEGGLLRGPLVLKSGEQVAIDALVGLSLDMRHIDLLLDLKSPDSPSIVSHGEIHIEGKKGKWDGTIVVPENATPFSKFSDALNALRPKEEIWNDEYLDENSGSLDLTGMEDTPLSLSGMEVQ